MSAGLCTTLGNTHTQRLDTNVTVGLWYKLGCISVLFSCSQPGRNLAYHTPSLHVESHAWLSSEHVCWVRLEDTAWLSPPAYPDGEVSFRKHCWIETGEEADLQLDTAQ